VFNHLERSQTLNYLYNGIKIVKFEYLRNRFDGDLAKLRTKFGCNIDILSRIKSHSKTLKCEGKLILKAGWHFSYVLNDHYLLKKFKGSADTEDINRSISKKERNGRICPQCSLQDFGLFQANLP